MKKTALTVGAVSLLGQGAALADPHCPRHGSYCEWVKRVDVKFTAIMNPHPSPTAIDRCGDVYTGVLSYTLGFCNKADEIVKDIPVSSGGFIDGKMVNNVFVQSNPHLVQSTTSDTAVPAGGYSLNLTPQGTILGFDLEPQPPSRTAIEVHEKRRAHGSSGCVAFLDEAGAGSFWDTFKVKMEANKLACVHALPNPVPIGITYVGVAAPAPTWKAGHTTTGTCTNC